MHFETVRARQLRTESLELCERLGIALSDLRAVLSGSGRCLAELRATAEADARALSVDSVAATAAAAAAGKHRLAKKPQRALATAGAGPAADYTVYLEGGTFSHAKRSSAAGRYKAALEANYGSPSAVIDAMTTADPIAARRWAAATAYARWSALAPHEFAGVGEFTIRRGSEFTSG